MSAKGTLGDAGGDALCCILLFRLRILDGWMCEPKRCVEICGDGLAVGDEMLGCTDCKFNAKKCTAYIECTLGNLHCNLCECLKERFAALDTALFIPFFPLRCQLKVLTAECSQGL